MILDNEQNLQFKMLLSIMLLKSIPNIQKVDIMRLFIHNKPIYNHGARHHLIEIEM